MKLPFKKYLFNTLKVSAMGAPFAILASCTGNDAPQISLEAEMQAYFASVVTNPTSNNDNLTWKSIPAQPSRVLSISYLPGNYSTLNAVQNAPDYAWQTQLPRSIAFDFSLRHLWARVIPQNPADLPIDKQFFDLTTLSGLQQIRARIDGLIEHSALNVSQIKLEGTTLKFATSLPSALPRGTQLTFQISGGAFLSEAQFQTQLATLSPTLTRAALDTINVQLEVTDSTKYILLNTKLAHPNITNLSLPNYELDPAISSVVRSIEVDASSTHDTVSWVLPSALSSLAPRITYLSGDYPTQEAAAQATTWSSFLPTNISFTASQRYLWVKVAPLPGQAISNPFVNLTADSNIRTVRSKVDTLPSFSNVNLAKVTLTNTTREMQITESLANLVPNTKIHYRFRGKEFDSAADLADFFKLNYTAITPEEFTSVQAFLVVEDPSAYILVDNKVATPTSNSLVVEFSTPPSDVVTQVSATKVDLDSSTHDRLIWKDLLPLNNLAIDKVQYASGNFFVSASKAELTQLIWSDALPTEVNFNHNERKLFAKLTPRAGYRLVDPYVDLTISSSIQAVKSHLNLASDFINFNINRVVWSGEVTAPVVTTDSPIPAHSTLEFTLDNVNWMSLGEITSFIAAAKNRGQPLTIDAIDALRARLIATEPSLYTITSAPVGSVNVNNTYTTLSAVPSAIMGWLLDVKAAPQAVHNDVEWNFTGQESEEVTLVRYLGGDFPTLNSAKSQPESDWKISLPSEVDFNHSKRYLWALLSPSPRYRLPGDLIYVDLTSSSFVQEIISSLNDVAPVDLQGISISGPHRNPVLNTSNLVLNTNLDLVYSVVGQPFTSWINLTSYLSREYASILPRDFMTFRVKLIVKNPQKFSLSFDGEIEVDTTNLVYERLAFDSSFASIVNNIQVSPTSRHNQLGWVNTTFEVPDYISSLSYLSGDFATLDAAENAPQSLWKPSLPAEALYTHDARHLWVRAVANSGYALTNPILDLTKSSGIQNVLARGDSLAAHRNFIFDFLKLSGSSQSPLLDYVNATLLPEWDLEYSFDGSLFTSREVFLSKIVDSSETILPSDLTSFKVRLTVKDKTKFIIDDLKTTTVNSTNFQIIHNDIPAALSQSISQLRPVFSGYHNSVSWSGFTLPSDVAISSYEFLSGNFPTLASVRNAAANFFSAALPTTLSTDHEQRYVWMKVNGNGFMINQPFVNLTTLLDVQNVPLLIDALPSYAAFDPSRIVFSGSTTNPQVEINNVLPINSRVKYQFQLPGSAWLSQSDFLQLLATSNLSPSELTLIKARLDVVDNPSGPSVIIDKKESPVITDELYIEKATIDEGVITAFNTIVATPDSLHDNLKWNLSSFVLPSSYNIASYEFLSTTNRYKKSDLAALPSSSWSASLPTATSYSSSDRHLWVKLNPVQNFDITDPYLEITFSSRLQDVKSHIDLASGFNAISLSTTALSGNSISPVLTATTPGIDNLELRFKVGASSWLKSSEFITYIKSNDQILTPQDLTTAQVRLAVADESRFVITDTKTTAINVASFALVRTVPTSVLNALSNIKWSANSRHNSTTWENLPSTLPTFIARIEYLSTSTYLDINTPNLITPNWSDAPGTSWTKLFDRRFLNARAIATSGYEIIDATIDLTFSSKVQSIPVQVDALTDFSLIDLNQITFSGSVQNAVIDITPAHIDPLITSPAYASDQSIAYLYYQINNGSWVKQADFIEWLADNALALSPSLLATIRVKLVVSNPDLYILNYSTIGIPNVSALNIEADLLLANFINDIGSISATPQSVHDNVSWVIPFTLPSQVSALNYLSGNFSTSISAAQVDNSLWANSLPTTISFIHNERFLYVRIVLASGYTLKNNLFDITTACLIQGVRSRVDVLPSFADLNLGNISLSGTQVNPTLSNHTSLLDSFPSLKLTYKSSALWQPEATFLANLATFSAATFTPQMFDDLQVRLEVSDATKYVLDNAKVAIIKTTNFAVYESSSLLSLVPALSQLTLASSSRHNALTWLGTNFALPRSIASLSYLSGNYPTLEAAKNAPEGAWSSSLPTQTLYEASERYFYIRANAASQYNLANFYYDATSTSLIRNAVTQVDAATNFSSLNLSLITFVASNGVLTINESAISVPNGAIVTYQYQGIDYTLSGLKAYLEAEQTNINRSQAGSVRIYLKPLSTSFAISNNKISDVTLTTVNLNFYELITIPAALEAALQAVVATSSSIHSAVTFTNSIFQLPSSIASVRFLSGYYPTITAAQSAEVVNFNNTLPTSLEYDSSRRFLWAQVTPQSGFRLVSNFVNLSISSNIQNVITQVDAAPQYAALRLNSVALSGSSTAPLFNNASFNLPVGSKIMFAFKDLNSGWLDSAAMQRFIITSQSQITSINIASLSARLEATDSRYRVDNDLESLVDVSAFRITPLDLPASFTISLGGLAANIATSNHETVQWSNAVLLPSNVERIVYLYGNYSTISAASSISVNNWQSALPSSIDFTPSNRYLYAQVVPKPGYVIATTIFDLTSTSRIQMVVSKLDNLPTYSQMNLTNITITNLTEDAIINETPVNLIDEVRVLYSFKTSGWVDKAAFIEYLRTNASTILPTELSNIRAKLEVKDATRHVLFNTLENLPNSSDLKVKVQLPTTFITSINRITFDSNSFHDRVIWISSFALPISVNNVQYLSGNFATEQEALAASGWVSTLPSVVDYTHENRNLWIRFNPNARYVLAVTTMNLTSTSRVRNIISKVDSHPSFSSINLRNVTITGNTVNIIINEAAALIVPGARATYSIKGDAYVSGEALKQQISSATVAYTTNDIKSIYVQLDTADAAKFKVVNLKTNLPTVNVKIAVSQYPTKIQNSINSIKATTSSTHNNLKYNSSISFDGTASSFSYLTGNYNTAQEAAAADPSAWKSALPSSIAYIATERRLWLRINASSSYEYLNPYVNITTSSGVDIVKGLADVTPEYLILNLANVVVRINSATRFIGLIDESSVTIPFGTTIEYSLGTTGVWYSRDNFVSTYASTAIFGTGSTTINARLVSSNPALYIVNNIKTARPYILLTS